MERITEAAVSVGLPGPSVPFLLALLVAPLVSALHTSLFHGAAVRHATSVLLGCALCLFVFDLASTGRLFVPVAFTYALMLVSRKFAGVLVFVATFAYLIFWCARCLFAASAVSSPRARRRRDSPAHASAAAATWRRPAVWHGRRARWTTQVRRGEGGRDWRTAGGGKATAAAEAHPSPLQAR